MPRLAITLVLALAAASANPQGETSGQTQVPGVASANGTQPFLFDGRMRGDGVGLQQRGRGDDHHPTAGAIVVPSKGGQPVRER